jgi:hypothetical protein
MRMRTGELHPDMTSRLDIVPRLMRAKDPGASLPRGFPPGGGMVDPARDITNVTELLSSPASTSELDFIIAEAGSWSSITVVHQAGL